MGKDRRGWKGREDREGNRREENGVLPPPFTRTTHT